jgi:hypothetical protein
MISPDEGTALHRLDAEIAQRQRAEQAAEQSIEALLSRKGARIEAHDALRERQRLEIAGTIAAGGDPSMIGAPDEQTFQFEIAAFDTEIAKAQRAKSAASDAVAAARKARAAAASDLLARQRQQFLDRAQQAWGDLISAYAGAAATEKVAIEDFGKETRAWIDPEDTYGAAGTFLQRLGLFAWPTWPDDLRPAMFREAGPQLSIFRMPAINDAATELRAALSREVKQ